MQVAQSSLSVPGSLYARGQWKGQPAGWSRDEFRLIAEFQGSPRFREAVRGSHADSGAGTQTLHA